MTLPAGHEPMRVRKSSMDLPGARRRDVIELTDRDEDRHAEAGELCRDVPARHGATSEAVHEGAPAGEPHRRRNAGVRALDRLPHFERSVHQVFRDPPPKRLVGPGARRSGEPGPARAEDRPLIGSRELGDPPSKASPEGIHRREPAGHDDGLQPFRVSDGCFEGEGPTVAVAEQMDPPELQATPDLIRVLGARADRVPAVARRPFGASTAELIAQHDLIPADDQIGERRQILVGEPGSSMQDENGPSATRPEPSVVEPVPPDSDLPIAFGGGHGHGSSRRAVPLSLK
jgi:hypothetical protein